MIKYGIGQVVTGDNTLNRSVCEIYRLCIHQHFSRTLFESEFVLLSNASKLKKEYTYVENKINNVFFKNGRITLSRKYIHPTKSCEFKIKYKSVFFADDNYEFYENYKKFTEWVENV